ncbi:GL19745 [Drosophila persimilis]|uniref:GL19745 n=1 Tax=Drosophila persimilis TaxID=7234 RepID=B4HB50_DROPE|nr:GL19745 [Drosophila persimilis]
MDSALHKLKIVYGSDGDVTEIYSDVFNLGYYGFWATIFAFAVFAFFVLYQRQMNRRQG